MKERITKLIDLKSIITLALAITLIYGFRVGKIEGKDFLVYVTMVFTFYFAKKDIGDENMSKSNLEQVETNGEATGTEEATEKAEV